LRNLRYPFELLLTVLFLSTSIVVILPAASRAQTVSYETRPQGLEEVERLTTTAMRLIKSGNQKAALIAFQSAATKARLHLGPTDYRYIQSLNNLALAYETSGSLNRSERIYRQAIAIAEAQPKLHAGQLPSLHNNLAAVLLQQCRITDARALYQRALVLSEKSLGAQHTDTIMVRYNVERLDRYLSAPQPTRASIVQTNLGSRSSDGIGSLLQRCVS
jgi:tetratricopeptide (TPR) repeat protein